MKVKKWGRGVLAVAIAATMAVSAIPSVSAVTFDAADTAKNLVAANSASVELIASAGVAEAAYAEWGAVAGATGYNVYVDGEQIDSMLIRQYPDRFRADAVGLKAGSHTMKIVPIIDGKEDGTKAAETSISVTAHDRSGFGFVNGTSSGAYNDDGTLKSDAVVLYVTEDTKDTVTMDVVTKKDGTTETFTGIQNILNAIKSNSDLETRPICVRFIGNITDPATLDKGDMLIDGNKEFSAGITLEGIGNDATFNGFGLRLKNCINVEVRNLGFMNCNSGEGDNVGLQQNNDHVWVHNCDFFYGDAGSDADQVKGDGALDTKTSSYVTHSYNHFWDNGKCNLQGMKSESTENYITYHHNWYDHSDSRHPRIRTCTVHVYNNYYDGNSKYGIGSTMGSSVFSENNYFRNCKYPMLISMQGSDIANGEEGTFSEEDGGVIKSYGNYIEGAKAYVSYQQNNTEFDAYDASSRDEKVPSSVTTKQGGTTYNNFDTDSSIMYSYTADKAEDVPSIVMANAGRVQGGDFQWTFDDSVDDESYDVNQALKDALVAYDDSIVAIGSGFTDDTDVPATTTAPQTTTTGAVITTTVSATGEATSPIVTTTNAPVVTTPVEPQAGDIFCAPGATGSGESANDPASVTDAIAKLSAGNTIWLLEGTYEFSETIVISENNSGTADAMKSIRAYNGADVVFDFSGQGAPSDSRRGIVLDGDYWHFYGFEITKAADNGMLLSGNNNIIERMIFNDNQDSGLQLSRYNTSAATIADWPTNNLILNCTSKNNCDNKTMENADGFAAKLTCGEGNVFDGCLSYNNSDDGWDLFAKKETGPIGVVTIQNCIAFRNGYTEFGEGYGDCDGNGFKLGGSGIGSAHVVKNCLAFENLNCGFTDNNNPKLESLTNCTAYNNGVGSNGKPNISCYRCTDDGADFSNIISYYSADNVTSNLGADGLKITNDKFVGTIQNAIYYNSGYYLVTDKVAIDNGAKLGTKGNFITDSDFVSVTAPEMGTDFDTAWRNADGSITTHGFMELKDSSAYASVEGASFEAYDGIIVTTPIVTTPVEETTTTAAGTTMAPIETDTPTGTTTAAPVDTNTPDDTTTATPIDTDTPAETTTVPVDTDTPAGTTMTAPVDTDTPDETSTAPIDTDTPDNTTSGSGDVSTTTTTAVSTTSETIPDGVSTLCGDVNLDGTINMADVILLSKASVNMVELSAAQRANADCFDDSQNQVDGNDAMTLLRFQVQLISSIPVQA